MIFNGCTQHDIENSKRNGTHGEYSASLSTIYADFKVWVQNGGIVGRGILLDWATWAESQNIKVDPLTTYKITLSDIKKVAEAQGVTFHPNDILFIRSGYINALSSLPKEEYVAYAAKIAKMPSIGVESCEEIIKWIWENQFAAVAGDMIAFEATPFQNMDFCLHEWLLAGWGLPIGELFDLEALAEECKRLGKWSFFFSSVPLHVSTRDWRSDEDLLTRTRFPEGSQARPMELLSCKDWTFERFKELLGL